MIDFHCSPLPEWRYLTGALIGVVCHDEARRRVGLSKSPEDVDEVIVIQTSRRVILPDVSDDR